MGAEVEIKNTIPGLIDNKTNCQEHAQIIGEKRKRTESEISEKEFQICKEEYLEVTYNSENHVTTEAKN
jgi:hypothetical protein